jgi:hypothetical protein
VWKEQFGLDVPSYAESCATPFDHHEVAALITGNLGGPWRQVDDPRPGDGVLLRVMGQPVHVGVIVDPPTFLHIARGINACLDRLDSPRWNRRVLGIYRHEELAA